MNKNSGEKKRVLVVGEVTADGVKARKLKTEQQIFFCKSKKHDNCPTCPHSSENVGKTNNPRLGNFFNQLFHRTEAFDCGLLLCLEGLFPKCFVPDCGNVIYLSNYRRKQAREKFLDFFELRKNAYAAYFVLIFSKMGLKDIFEIEKIEGLVEELEKEKKTTPAEDLRKVFKI